MITATLTPNRKYAKRTAAIIEYAPLAATVTISNLTHGGAIEVEGYFLHEIDDHHLQGVRMYGMDKQDMPEGKHETTIIHLGQYPNCTCTARTYNRAVDCKHIAICKAWSKYVEPVEAVSHGPDSFKRAEGDGEW